MLSLTAHYCVVDVGLREAHFEVSEEELRCYFPLDHVLSGLFNLASRLFGVTIEVRARLSPCNSRAASHRLHVL